MLLLRNTRPIASLTTLQYRQSDYFLQHATQMCNYCAQWQRRSVPKKITFHKNIQRFRSFSRVKSAEFCSAATTAEVTGPDHPSQILNAAQMEFFAHASARFPQLINDDPAKAMNILRNSKLDILPAVDVNGDVFAAYLQSRERNGPFNWSEMATTVNASQMLNSYDYTLMRSLLPRLSKALNDHEPTEVEDISAFLQIVRATADLFLPGLSSLVSSQLVCLSYSENVTEEPAQVTLWTEAVAKVFPNLGHSDKVELESCVLKLGEITNDSLHGQFSIQQIGRMFHSLDKLYPLCGSSLFSLTDYVTADNVSTLPLNDLITVGCYVDRFRENQLSGADQLPDEYVSVLVAKLQETRAHWRLIDFQQFVGLINQQAVFEDSDDTLALFSEIVTNNLDLVLNHSHTGFQLEHATEEFLDALWQLMSKAVSNSEFTTCLALYAANCGEDAVAIERLNYVKRLENFGLHHLEALLESNSRFGWSWRQSPVLDSLFRQAHQQFTAFVHDRKQLDATVTSHDAAVTSLHASELQCRASLFRVLQKTDDKAANALLLTNDDTSRYCMTLREEEELMTYYATTLRCSSPQITQLVSLVVDSAQRDPEVQRARLINMYTLFIDLQVEDVFLAHKLYAEAKRFFYEDQRNQEYLACVDLLDKITDTGVYPRLEIKLLRSKEITSEIYEYLRKHPTHAKVIQSRLAAFSDLFQRKNYAIALYCLVILSPIYIGIFLLIRSYIKTFFFAAKDNSKSSEFSN